jgi:hypothetical protein
VQYDSAVHSDFLIHWTGRDLDQTHDPHWYQADRSNIQNPELVTLYLRRLHNILQYGLWLTSEPETTISLGQNRVTLPATPKVCFTELKLSESRRHARDYGRLGIGVKRPYLFDRLGRPLAYYGYHNETVRDAFLEACANDFKDLNLLNFFKPMNRTTQLNYDLYGESEWRILYRKELETAGLIMDPALAGTMLHQHYYQSLAAPERARLKYLAPLDGWLAMIIYPSLEVKNAAQQPSSSIRARIQEIKGDQGDHGNKVEGGNWPIEVNLDACRHF